MRFYIRFLTVLIATIATCYWVLFYTTTGTRFILKWLPSDIHYHEFYGNLHEGLQLKQVSIKYNQHTFDIADILLTVHLQPAYNFLVWQVESKTGLQDLSQFSPKLAGTAEALFKINGKLSLFFRHMLKLKIYQIDGNLYQQPISGQGDIVWFSDRTLIINALKLNTGHNYLDVQGKVAKRWDITWHVHVPKLNQIIAESAGSIIGNGKITGPYKRPQLSSKMVIKDFHYSTLEAADLTIDSQVLGDSMTLTMVGTDLNYQNKLISRLNFIGKVIKNKQNAVMNIVTPETETQLKLYGELKPKIWRANITASSHKPLQSISEWQVLAKLSPRHKMSAWKTYPLNLDITGHIASLAFLNPLINGVDNIDGKLNSQWHVAGTPSRPQLQGQLQIASGRARYINAGCLLKDIELTVNTRGVNQFNYQGRANVGEGHLKLDGYTLLQHDQYVTKLNLVGNDAQVVANEVAKLSITPNLKITIDQQTIDISGDILIPKALISPADYSNTVTLSSDVIFADDQNKEDIPWKFSSNINLRLGHEVLLHYMGLKAILAGAVNLRDSDSKATIATGQLYVSKGRFDAYGQSLPIKQGQLTFTASPVTNPELNIRATKNVGAISTTNGGAEYLTANTMVGVTVTGSLQNPKINLFSDPKGLTQAQILSQLVLGKPLSEVDNDKNKLLQSLEDSEGKTAQSKKLLAQLKQGLGLDEISLQTGKAKDSQQTGINTSLTLGKFLSPRLLLSYTMGLSESVNVFTMTYRINNKWLLRTQSDIDSNSVDLLYSIETD